MSTTDTERSPVIRACSSSPMAQHLTSVTFRSVLFVSIIVTLLQCLAWMTLTAMGIAVFRCVLPVPQYEEDNIIPAGFIKFYFEGDECKLNNNLLDEIRDQVQLTKPVDVNAWMVAYLVITVAHFMLSASLFYNRTATWEYLRIELKMWCILALVIICMDAGLTSLFVGDYIRLSDHVESTKEGEHVKSVPLAMAVISGRGFALWVFNIFQTIYFILWSTKTSKNKKVSLQYKEQKHDGGANYDAAYNNYGFPNSSESLNHHGNSKPETVLHNPMQNAVLQKTNSERKRFSIESFEAVTAFNEEIKPPAPMEKPELALDKSKLKKNDRNSSGYTCNCYLPESDADKKAIRNREQEKHKVYHGHDCSMVTMELERKFHILGLDDIRPAAKPKHLPDFAHDIRNFKQGAGIKREQFNGQEPIARKPKAPALPRVATRRESDFY